MNVERLEQTNNLLTSVFKCTCCVVHDFFGTQKRLLKYFVDCGVWCFLQPCITVSSFIESFDNSFQKFYLIFFINFQQYNFLILNLQNRWIILKKNIILNDFYLF